MQTDDATFVTTTAPSSFHVRSAELLMATKFKDMTYQRDDALARSEWIGAGPWWMMKAPPFSGLSLR